MNPEYIEQLISRYGSVTSEPLRDLIYNVVEDAVLDERERIAKLFDGEVWAYDYREIAARIRGEK